MTRRLIVAAVLGGFLAAAPGAFAAPAAGTPIGTIVIARIHLRATFAQGVSAAVLANGPGHYPQTDLPGQQGTVGIAGHRITHTHPFRRLNVLRHGDRIVLIVGSSAHPRRLTYVVYAMRIVRPSVVWPLASLPHAQRLVLTAFTRRELLRSDWLFSPAACLLSVDPACTDRAPISHPAALASPLLAIGGS